MWAARIARNHVSTISAVPSSVFAVSESSSIAISPPLVRTCRARRALITVALSRTRVAVLHRAGLPTTRAGKSLSSVGAREPTDDL